MSALKSESFEFSTSQYACARFEHPLGLLMQTIKSYVSVGAINILLEISMFQMFVFSLLLCYVWKINTSVFPAYCTHTLAYIFCCVRERSKSRFSYLCFTIDTNYVSLEVEDILSSFLYFSKLHIQVLLMLATIYIFGCLVFLYSLFRFCGKQMLISI